MPGMALLYTNTATSLFAEKLAGVTKIPMLFLIVSLRETETAILFHSFRSFDFVELSFDQLVIWMTKHNITCFLFHQILLRLLFTLLIFMYCNALEDAKGLTYENNDIFPQVFLPLTNMK